MKTNKNLLWMLAAMLAATFNVSSCASSDDSIDPSGSDDGKTDPAGSKGLTITATMEGGGTTSRAYFSDKKNLWSTGDQIGITVENDDTTPYTLTLTSGEGSTIGNFSNSAVPYTQGKYITALYPASAAKSISDADVVYNVPLTQTVTLSKQATDTYDPAACVMAAYGKDPLNMYFYNLCTLIRLPLPAGSTKYKSVIFKANNPNALLGGEARATFTNANSEPSYLLGVANNERSVTVNISNAPYVASEPSYVYATVIPHTYNGFGVYVTTEIEVTDGGKTTKDEIIYHKITSGDITLKRSGLVTCEEFSEEWDCGLAPCDESALADEDKFCSSNEYRFRDLGVTALSTDGTTLTTAYWGNKNIGATNTYDTNVTTAVGSTYGPSGSTFTLKGNAIEGCYGDYFKWVQFTTDASTSYGKTPRLFDGTSDTPTSSDYGSLTSSNNLKSAYDIAYVTGQNLSSKVEMYMPTANQFQYLHDCCYWVYCDGVKPTIEEEKLGHHHRQHKGEVAGWIVFKVKENATTGKAGKQTTGITAMDPAYTLEDTHIFLPCAGSFKNDSGKATTLSSTGTATTPEARYWSRHEGSDTRYGDILYLQSSSAEVHTDGNGFGYKNEGNVIRPMYTTTTTVTTE